MRAALLGLCACSSLLDLQPPPAPADAAAPYWSFSDDFDLGDFRRWTQVVEAPNGTLEVGSGNSVSGCCALHATVEAGSSGYEYAMIAWPQDSAPPVTSGTIAIRARVQAQQLADDTRELSIAQGGTDATAFATSGLGASSAAPGFSWGFFLSDPAEANFSRQSANVIGDALGGWHCVEFDMTVGSAGHLAIYMDDSPVAQIESDVPTDAGTGWDSAQVGIGYASGSAPTELWIDDVVVALYTDAAPGIHIGCGD